MSSKTYWTDLRFRLPADSLELEGEPEARSLLDQLVDGVRSGLRATPRPGDWLDPLPGDPEVAPSRPDL